ncbi:HEAT repeat domain-containing protein [Streptomyces meridianus]|uniref:HEAT repeat domain-containing protein n=1 Tax=Streptomyces meridianus TaxID=2938945 RepID=A0ABT0X2F8_9ACTN|nr:HEAT repeat domain-containing protein [Streptomyces meridianus]MCM2576714.1 HEAT repeat domain-containing protein [Streptomyces meridianus]
MSESGTVQQEFDALAERVRPEIVGPEAAVAHAGVTTGRPWTTAEGRERLARILTEPAQPLGLRELAAFGLGCAGDRRAFETLVLLLNHRDPARCASAASALARLGDPRTMRAAAALATNPLRTAYALHPVRLLTGLREPESVPALIATLERLLAPTDPHWRIALACVEGLGELGDDRAVPVLTAARDHPRLSEAAGSALAQLGVPV